MYQVRQRDPNTFEFDTNSGINYIVGFSSAEFRFENICTLRGRVDEICFDPTNGNPATYDQNISSTICDLIRNRCKHINGAVLYVCSSTDAKQRNRAITFAKWYKEHNSNDYHIETASLSYMDSTIYVGLIIPIDNPDITGFVGEFKYMIEQVEAKQI